MADDQTVDGLETRHYIGLMPNGLRVSAKYGPDPAAKFAHIGPHQPLDMNGFRVFPVDEAVWREWVADDAD